MRFASAEAYSSSVSDSWRPLSHDRRQVIEESPPP